MRDDDDDHVHETKGWEAVRSAVWLHEQSWALDELRGWVGTRLARATRVFMKPNERARRRRPR